MKLGILKTGRPPSSAIPQFGTYPDMFRKLLGPAIRTFEPWIMRDKFSRLTQGERLYLMR